MSKIKMTTVSEHRCFDGVQGFYRMPSELCAGDMTFSVYSPPQAGESDRLPVVTYLSGLTCTEENFTAKAGFQRIAAELGLLVVAPDTSPREAGYPGEDDAYDFGTGAGFYVDATEEPWSGAYRMYSFVTKELARCIEANFPADMGRQGIMGHSMGGHGALVIHLRNPETYRSVSAFAPICSPMNCPWGQKAFSGYLGEDRARWRDYDACELIRRQPSQAKLLIDQGTADPFLEEQLKPDSLVEACEAAGQHFDLRMQAGYDHSYYFIASFIADHLRHHAETLGARPLSRRAATGG